MGFSMNFELYFAFVAATALLIIMPGPSVTLTIANSISGGVRSGLLTVAGGSSAIVLQLAVTCIGMTSLMLVLASWVELIRWFGVAYLVYLGVQYWRQPQQEIDLPATGAPGNGRRSFAQGFIIAATNPKTLFFYAAFFPQFVDPTLPPGPQLVLLSATFFVVAACLDSTYAVLAGRARPFFEGNGRGKAARRFTGTMLIGAGLGLALARKS